MKISACENLPQSAKWISYRVSGISNFASAKYITRRRRISLRASDIPHSPPLPIDNEVFLHYNYTVIKYPITEDKNGTVKAQRA